MKEKIIELRKNKKTYEEISNILNISKYKISKICREFNLTESYKYGKKTEEEINEIRKLYDELKSSIKVAKLLNVSKGTVLKYIDVKKLTEEQLKENRSKSVIEWRRRTKLKLIEYKGGECEICKYNKCIDALEFHHKDPNEKDFTISGKSWSFDRLKKEVDKCIMVCANCHREIHYEEKYKI